MSKTQDRYAYRTLSHQKIRIFPICEQIEEQQEQEILSTSSLTTDITYSPDEETGETGSEVKQIQQQHEEEPFQPEQLLEMDDIIQPQVINYELQNDINLDKQESDNKSVTSSTKEQVNEQEITDLKICQVEEQQDNSQLSDSQKQVVVEEQQDIQYDFGHESVENINSLTESQNQLDTINPAIKNTSFKEIKRNLQQAIILNQQIASKQFNNQNSKSTNNTMFTDIQQNEEQLNAQKSVSNEITTQLCDIEHIQKIVSNINNKQIMRSENKTKQQQFEQLSSKITDITAQFEKIKNMNIRTNDIFTTHLKTVTANELQKTNKPLNQAIKSVSNLKILKNSFRPDE